MHEQQTTVLEIKGRLDGLASPELEGRIKAALDARPPGLVLDFDAVDFVSSAGLRVLLSASKRCRQQGTKLALHSIKTPIADVFDMGGLTAFLPMYADRVAALAAVRPAQS